MKHGEREGGGVSHISIPILVFSFEKDTHKSMFVCNIIKLKGLEQ